MWFYYIFKSRNNGTTLSLVTEASMLGTFRKLTSRLRFHTVFVSPPPPCERWNHTRPLTTDSSWCKHLNMLVRRPIEMKMKIFQNRSTDNTHSSHTHIRPVARRIYCVNKNKKITLTTWTQRGEIIWMALSSSPSPSSLWNCGNDFFDVVCRNDARRARAPLCLLSRQHTLWWHKKLHISRRLRNTHACMHCDFSGSYRREVCEHLHSTHTIAEIRN